MLARNFAYRSRREILRGAGVAIGAFVAPGLGLNRARAAGYPDRPIKIIVPFAPAGPTDIMARILSTHLGEAIGGTGGVENQPGGGRNNWDGPAAIPAVLGGTTQVAFAALPPAHPHIESGALKALAVTGAHRWFDLQDVPTMVELGYKDFISDTFQGFLAPAKTPPAVVELLSAKSIEILKRPKISEQLRNDGFEVLANGPDGMRKRIEAEVPKWRDIVAKAGIKPV